MSRPLRIALVVEGSMEKEVIEAALGAILAPRTFVLATLQPDATRPKMGTGWSGVLKWCEQAAGRAGLHDGAVEADPTLVGYDGVILHLDADVASFDYDHVSSTRKAEAEQAGWLPLPCAWGCPPAALDGDALKDVLLSWLRPAVPGPRLVFCLPAMNTGAWLAAAKLPAGHELLQNLECNIDIEDRLQYLPKKYKVNKKNKESRDKAASLLKTLWPQVIALCTRAQAFDQEVRNVFP